MSEEYWIKYYEDLFKLMTPQELKAYCKEECRKELREFEETVPMTIPERTEVRKWVHKGNSVYTNPWHTAYGDGYEMNYLDAIRTDF